MSTEPTGFQTPRRQLLNVQAARGTAAVLVVLFHTDKFYFDSTHYWRKPALEHFFAFGHAGVFFFFVLSGFIIFTAHSKDIGDSTKIRSYAVKRFTRVYPFYWVGLALTLLMLMLFPGTGLPKSRDATNIIGSALLAGINPLNATMFIAWTLFYEILFYALFALVLASRRYGIAALLIWWGLCAFTTLSGMKVPYPFGTVNLLFGMGVTVAALASKVRLRAGWSCTIGGIVAFVFTGLDDVYWHRLTASGSMLSFGLASMLILAGVLHLEERQIVAPRFMIYSGDASYAIYLTHMLALGVGAKALMFLHAPSWMAVVPAFALIALAGVLGGMLAHRFVEKPLVKLARRWFDPRKSATR